MTIIRIEQSKCRNPSEDALPPIQLLYRTYHKMIRTLRLNYLTYGKQLKMNIYAWY